MPSSFRTFNSPGGQLVNGVAYIYDTVSGMFRPAFDSDFGAAVNMSVSGLSLTVGSVAITGTLPNVAVTGGYISVSNTAPMPVSGISLINNTAPIATSGVATILSVPTHNVAVTGGQIQTIVTGVLGGNVTVTSVAVTGGSISVNNTAPIAISGMVTTSATIGNVAITGGYVNVSNTAPIAISGIVQTVVTGSVSSTTDLTPMVLAQASGNALIATSNSIASGISGLLGANLTDPAYVTGQVGITTAILPVSGLVTIGNTAPMAVSGVTQANITNATPVPVSGVAMIGNTAPIAISGFVNTIVTGTVSSSITNPIGVTGTSYDTALPTMPGTANFLAIGGRVVAASGAGSITGYNSTGDYAILNISKENGGVFVNQGALDYTQDAVTAIFSGNSAVSNRAVSGVAQAVLAANPNRQYAYVQNLATGWLMLGLGATPTTGSLNAILGGATALNDGKGGTWSTDRYRGSVYVSGVDPAAPMTYIAWEL